MICLHLSPGLFFILLAGLNLVWASDISLVPFHTTVTKFVNTKYFVTCMAPHSDLIVWTKDGTKKIDKNSGKVHTESSVPGELQLVFEDIRKEDNGDYICKARYPGSHPEQKFTMEAIEPISFSNNDEVQSAPEGSDYTIRCDASGGGNITIKLKTHEPRHKGLSYQLTSNGLLFIKNISMDYGGKYSCHAFQLTAQLSSYKESNITLKIQHEPRWTNAVEKFVGFVGGTINLTCSALAEPGAKFSWIKDNKTLFDDRDVQIFNSDHHSTLQLYIYDDSVFGGYECQAKNTMGRTARVLYLEEASRPFAPTFKIVDTGRNSLVLEIIDSAVVNKDKAVLDVDGYVVEFMKTKPGSQGTQSKEQQFHRTSGQSYTLAGVDADTKYEVRVASRTAAGAGEFSEFKSASTKKWTAATTASGSNHDSLASYLHQWILTALMAALLSVNLCV